MAGYQVIHAMYLITNKSKHFIFAIKTKIKHCAQVKIGHRQRFVSSIGNIEKAKWVFDCLGRLGCFWQY